MISKLIAAVLFLLFLAVPGSPASATGTPTEQVRATVDRVITVLQDSHTNAQGKKDANRAELLQLIAARFDFEDMAKRSMGSHWQRCQPEQQREFVKLFTNLLERSYLDRIESYNGEKVLYTRESKDTDRAEVDTKIVTKKGDELSVNYRLHAVGEDWKVYDVVVEDISLVNNYRSQFNRVLASSSIDDLLQRLKAKE